MASGNPFTSAQAPAYNLLAPDIGAQQAQVTRQQRLADMLREQSLAPMGGTDVVGGWAIKKSPFEALGKMAQALGANHMQGKVDTRNLELAKAMQERMGAAFDGMAGGASGGMGRAPQAGNVMPTLPEGAPAPAAGEMPTTPVPQQAPQQSSQVDLIRNQAKAAYMMGNTELANKLLENISTMTEGQRTDNYLGITSAQARQAELAKREKEGYIAPTSLRGQAYMDRTGKISTLPDSAQPGYMNNFDQATGQWSTAPVPGGLESVQASEKAKSLGKTLGTLGQGVDETGTPAYFVGLPPGAVGAPPDHGQQPMPAPSPGPQTRAPAAIDLNHMTPQQNQSLMDQAANQFGLRPGATPGRSVTGQPPSVQPAPTRGVIRPGNAPGQNEFMQTTAAAAGKRVNDLVSTASESPTRINVLDNIISLSKGGVESGPSAEWINKAKGVMANVPGFAGWKDDVTGFQELKKYMNQNGLRAWQAAGGSGTDAQLTAAMAANPNDKMFPKAVQLMANWAKAGELALQGKANASHASGGATPQDQAKFEATWRQNMDPRIYQMKLMEPTEAQAFVANLRKSDPAGYQDLLKKAQNLKQMGGL